METAAHAVLSEWEAFYVIVGTSAGALTGLLFVVLTLVADSDVPRTPDTINAFGTPNVLHFVAVLLLSAILSAPWHRFRDPAHVVGLIAVAGVVYVLIVLRRMRRQTGYKAVFEDWLWHMILPLGAYAALFVGAMGLSHEQGWAPFTIAGVTLVLTCIGVHNAWDTVAYLVLHRREDSKTE
jgi:hypothetical protein